MFGIATIKETLIFLESNLPFSGIPLPFSTRQWEYPWCFSRLMDFGIKPGDSVLDVGCACNPFMVELSQRKFNVSGIDLYSVHDPRNPTPNFGGFDRSLENPFLKFFESDMKKMPFKDNSFDAVYCLSVLEHCEENIRLSGLKEMIRVLKPGKPLIITEDYIPNQIKTVTGVLYPCTRKMDYDFRKHILLTGKTLADPNSRIPTDDEISLMRDHGELLLNCAVAPNEYYHFTAIGWVVIK